eukprot:gene29270-36429_t
MDVHFICHLMQLLCLVLSGALQTLHAEGTASTLRIGALGDIIFEAQLQRQAFESAVGHYSSMWQDPSILKLLQSPQVTFANLEGTAASGVNAQGRNVPDPGLVYGVGDVYESEDNLYQFNYNPVVAAELKNSGIDIVSTANNHALDRSSLGVERTLDALDSAGILHIGTRRSGSQPFEGSWYTLLQSHGWNVAWVACTDNSHSATDSFSDPDRQVFSCSDSAFIPVVKDLSGRSDVDAVIVSVHWGGIVPERAAGHNGTSTNKLLGTKLPWDTCLALVDSNGDCGEEFYGGGEGGECGCIPRGGHCALGDSIVDAAVYKRYCPPESLHQQHKFDWTWKTILGVVAAGLILCMALGRIRKRLRGVIKARLGLSIEEDVYEQLDGQHAAAMEAQ